MSRTGLDWLPEALADLEDRDLLRVLTYCQGAPAPEVPSTACPTCCWPRTTTSAWPTTRPSSPAPGRPSRPTAPAPGRRGW